MSGWLNDPLTVVTQDGSAWWKRAVDRHGHGLYARSDSTGQCPELRTIRELAEFGLKGMADVPAAEHPQSYPPALPWARLMDHEDLTDFLDELAASAITHASSEVALGEVEATCGRWRLIAEAQYGHNTAPGPDAITQAFVPVQALREPEGEHYAAVHRDYRVSHDLPETGGAK